MTSSILPHFIIIGAMKCGTTTLYRYLMDHPDIGLSRDKETDFFVAEKMFDKGLEWYAAQFAPGYALYGEASPNYTKRDDFGGVPERIAAAVPAVKLIYIVRDPVDRFVSQYRHSWTIGDVDVTPDALHGHSEYNHIMRCSLYAHQLDAYLDHFPREQILVLDFDELRTDPESIMVQILSFIGAAPLPHAIEDSAHNDSAQLSRVPAPVLKFAQSPLGKRITGLFDRETRDRLRGMLAFGESRRPPAIPDTLLEQVRADVRDDAARFRQMTGLAFKGWSV